MANDFIDKKLEKAGIISEKIKTEQLPIYKVYEDSKIPVSRALGNLCKQKVDASLSKRKRKNLTTKWEEAVAYFKNDQYSHRNKHSLDTISTSYQEHTENIVFPNINSILPTIYTKNPTAEFTCDNADYKRLTTVIERLVNKLSSKKESPGFNLKPKVKKAIILALLTNSAWLETGYIKKEDSNEESLNQLIKLAEDYTKAKTKKELLEIEGKITAIERKTNFLLPSGPFVKFYRGDQVVTDPASKLEDGSDGTFMAAWDYIQTDLLKAIYFKEGNSEEYQSIFEPTHLLQSTEGDTSVHDEINSFSLFEQDNSEYSSYGFKDEESFRKSWYTKVWYYWDKVTRRLYLYNDKHWTWPIWVWDDPYKLEGFFPYTRMYFFTDPVDSETVGEVSYYLDQQDAINEINHERRKLRKIAMSRWIYNKNTMTEDDALKYIKGDANTVVGVSIDAGIPVTNALDAPMPPSVKYLDQLFNVGPELQAVERISAVNAVLRNAEFKTNTTNRAIESYESGTFNRLDEKIDSIEDCLGNVYWQIAQLCLQFMPKETVIDILGVEMGTDWQQLSPEDIKKYFHPRVVGGSSVKPTTKAKKEEAINIGQVLGQFASAAPATVEIMLRLYEQSFEGIIIKEEDWAFIRQSIQAQLARGSSNTGGGQVTDRNAMVQELQNRLNQKGVPEDKIQQVIANLPKI